MECLIPFRYKILGWRETKEQVWQNSHQFIAGTLRNFFAKSISHQICYTFGDFEEGKAYRYYKCEFVKEIFFHHVSPESKHCILKTLVTLSQRTSNIAYHVWEIIEKDGERPGEKI